MISLRVSKLFFLAAFVVGKNDKLIILQVLYKISIMTSEQLADKIELTELVNRLFMYCDARHWPRILDEVFTETIWFDASSVGGPAPANMGARAVCDMWNEGFAGIDAVHHQAGHYVVDLTKGGADIFGYAVATHYKKAATKGHTRTFTGSYDLKAVRTASGWRLSQFKYNMKFIDGNSSLE